MATIVWPGLSGGSAGVPFGARPTSETTSTNSLVIPEDIMSPWPRRRGDPPVSPCVDLNSPPLRRKRLLCQKERFALTSAHAAPAHDSWQTNVSAGSELLVARRRPPDVGPL